VKVHVETPSQLSDEQVKILEAFSKSAEPENYPLQQAFLKDLDKTS